ncbi:MAG TPA: T9SS type A sorting domain-containing protein [Bacteroidetes bacterium]|nr:T9SS type A sorting domain-containing protein [Bacteroidota bacterium]HEX04764.1 T9SS type A sorting domain-containing protein [Bacteroidota bacterium]
MVNNAQLYYDNVSDHIYCAWSQYGVDGDTTAEGLPRDASTTSGVYRMATDIWMSMSDDNGKHWAMPINVTQTRNEGTGLVEYETESEREMSLAINSDGDYIHLFYTVDYDPGIASPSTTPVGVATDNIMVYHSIAKSELIDEFNANAEWIRNYPLHVDSSNYYDDPDDWAWNGHVITSVKESNSSLQPDEFELKQNYPNPFNPSTLISFNMSQPGKVKLAVYDVLGREVATLIDRGMSAGSHSVNFYAGELASGVYFYNITSGNVTKTRKMVLLK